MLGYLQFSQAMYDPLGRFHALILVCNQSHTHPILTGVSALRFTGKITARQYGDMFLGKQHSGKFSLLDWCLWPKVEARIGHAHFKMPIENVGYSLEFLTVQRTVCNNVCFIIPRCDAGYLMVRGHRAAMVGAVKEEFGQYIRVSGNKARSQSR